MGGNAVKIELDKYINYYNNERIKYRLNGLSPVKYRTQTDLNLSKNLGSPHLNQGFCNGGGRIRTHGRLLTYNGFQDRRLKPLGHSSKGISLYYIFFYNASIFFKKFNIFYKYYFLQVNIFIYC